MDRLPLSDLLNEFAAFHSARQTFGNMHAIGAPPGETQAFTLLKSRAANFLRLLREADFPMTGSAMEQVVSALASGDTPDGSYRLTGQDFATLRGALERVGTLFPAETGQRWVMIVSPSYAGFLSDPPAAFGATFQTKFGGCLFDLDEAVRCLAANRATAAVFHLLRIMEAGLRAVHACLGLPPPALTDRSWGAILKNVQNEIVRRGAKWPERDLFQAQHALLTAVKQAWRDRTADSGEVGRAFRLMSAT